MELILKHFTLSPLRLLVQDMEQDILKYIYDKKLKIAKVYGDVIQTDLIGEKFELTGVKRTGC